jgi:NAD(P)-dependent dehydrogenase (short-subunit alcohol dehydrogenase family)
MPTRFQDTVVVITGAAQGIGRAAALRFAADGERVVLADLAGSDLPGCLAEIKKAGGQAIEVEADVTRKADIEKYVAKAESEYGGIDCFFNNAGILGVNRPFLEYPEEMFDRVFAVNVKADVADQIVAASGDPSVKVSRARAHADLARAVRAQLLRAGLAPANIERVAGCTYSAPQRFYSYRRDGARSGRHLAVIVAGC